MRKTIALLGAIAVLFTGVSALAQEPPGPGAAMRPPTSQTPPTSPPPSPVTVEPPVGVDRNALAGYHGGLFYLRDPEDNFRLYIQGRAQIDSYNYLGKGVPDTGLKSTVFLRRIRPELTGEFLKVWQFQIAGDWGQTGNDNNNGTNETFAAPPGTAPTAATARYASAQTATIRGGPTDVFLVYHPHTLFALQGGQFDAPLTMENRTSDKFIPFMERSLAVRVLGIPNNKEIGLMAWGETEDHFLFYSIGGFNGDGQNRINPDNRIDGIGRVFIHPLAGGDAPIRDMQIGASMRYGDRDRSYVNYDYPAMTTQGGFPFWSPIYNNANGARVHVLPADTQMTVAGELRVPVDIVDLTSEFVYVNNQTREAVEGYQATNTERNGALKGYSYYVMLGVWLGGKRDVNGLPGYENPPHLDLSQRDPAEPAQALQLLVKWEQLAVNYKGASRAGEPDPKGGLDGDVKVNAVSFGANYWATKHVRLTANYVFDMFPGSEPVASKKDPAGSPSQTSSQRALAPGNTIAPGIRDDARFNAHSLHEILFRVGVALLV